MRVVSYIFVMSFDLHYLNKLSPQKTGEIYLLRMKMVGDQVSIEGVEMFDLDKIDQYLKICFPNNANKIKEIKK